MNNISKEELELVGRVGVDSGQLIIGDPCYLDRWDSAAFAGCEGWPGVRPEPPFDYSYDGACRATLSECGAGTLASGSAVASSTCWGDGEYPVYAIRRHGGRIAALIVDMDNLFDSDGE